MKTRAKVPAGSQMAGGNTVPLGPDVRLTCETVERFATAGEDDRPAARLSAAAVSAMDASCATLEELERAGTPVYGTTTGFGPFVTYASGDGGRGLCGHGAGLLAHLGAGWGPVGAEWAPSETVRAAMLIRAQNLAQGFSGIRPSLLRAYLRLLEEEIVPCVPPVGSVGASGDLVPLAHIARALAGAEGALVYYRGQKMPVAAALEYAGLAPAILDGRDALAFTNGTSFLTGYAALAVARAERLVAFAEGLTGWMYRLLGARAQALDPRLHAARGHAGQEESAGRIRAEAARHGDWEDDSRPLQEVYSIRCAPQVLGACRENLAHARRLVETEINGASDNPLLFGGEGEPPAAVHGGNFHGQQVAFAADALNAALTQAGVLAERQIDALVTPSRTNNHAPLLLAWEPGATSGLAGAQLTATSLVAEMRSRAQMHATFSIPTNGDNQDVVSMGTLAARAALEQTERLAAILAIYALALHQLDFLRNEGRAQGRTTPAPPWAPPVEPVRQDRPLHADIARLCRHFLTADATNAGG